MSSFQSVKFFVVGVGFKTVLCNAKSDPGTVCDLSIGPMDHKFYIMEGAVDSACSSRSMGWWVKSHQGHWWCQEGHPTIIAPVLQR